MSEQNGSPSGGPQHDGYEEPSVAAGIANEEEDTYPPPASLQREESMQEVPLALTQQAERGPSSTAIPSPRPAFTSPPPNLNATMASSSSASLPLSSNGNSPQESPYRPSSSATRRSSAATSVSNGRMSLSGNLSGGPQLSVALIIPGLTIIAESKEARKNTEMEKAAKAAIELCQNNQAYGRPRDVLEPLRLACETKSEKLVITSLDLISKLVSHSFFHEFDESESGQPPLADLLAHTITMTYTETSPPAVALQVVKALLALVLSPTVLIHQSSLLKAVRTVYNVFLLSSEATNQMIAQGGLTQMVHHVFGRILTTPAPFHRAGSGSTGNRSARMTPEPREVVGNAENLARRQEAEGLAAREENGEDGEGMQRDGENLNGANGTDGANGENHMTL